jgi:hypothetical protein
LKRGTSVAVATPTITAAPTVTPANVRLITS